MLKNEKGITLATLVITIIVIVILASVATVSGLGAIDYVEFNNAKAQFQTMQAHVNSWYEEYKGMIDKIDKNDSLTDEEKKEQKQAWLNNYGKDLAEADTTKIQEMETNLEIDFSTSEYKYFNLEYIKNDLDIDGISYDFLINIKQRSVLLFGGIEYQGKIYYSAKEFGINVVEYEEISGNVGFEKKLKCENDKVYMLIYDIVLPDGISKYELKYQIEGSTYWTTVTSDMKDENGTWKILVETESTYKVKITTADKELYFEDSKEIPSTIIGCLRETGDNVTKKLTLTDENGEEITIPNGFSLASDSATQVKDGVVVVSPDGSEFVWIPVKDINSMVMCQAYTEDNKCSIKETDGKLVCENHTDKLICGKLYITGRGVDTFDSNLTSQNYSRSTGFKEPKVLTDTIEGDLSTTEGKGLFLLNSIVGIEGTVGEDDEKISAIWESQLQKEFEEMAKYVYKNDGFYIGRYETSLKEEKNKDGIVEKVAQSIKGKESATSQATSGNTWYGLYQKEKEYSEKNTLTNIVGSSMVWGSQYDQIMIWMQENGLTVNSVTPREGASANKSRITGSVETDKLSNIYDLIGNSWEMTLAAYCGASTGSRVIRGGHYLNGQAPAYVWSLYPHDSSSIYSSSRITLYVK